MRSDRMPINSVDMFSTLIRLRKHICDFSTIIFFLSFDHAINGISWKKSHVLRITLINHKLLLSNNYLCCLNKWYLDSFTCSFPWFCDLCRAGHVPDRLQHDTHTHICMCIYIYTYINVYSSNILPKLKQRKKNEKEIYLDFVGYIWLYWKYNISPLTTWCRTKLFKFWPRSR